MGQIIMRNWDIGELCVRVNLPSLRWQVQVLSWRGITPKRGLPNSITPVIPLISQICSYSLHRSHLHPHLTLVSYNCTIFAEYEVKLSLCISPCHDYEFTLSTAYTAYSIHRVQHPPKIACLPLIQMIIRRPLNVASAFGVPPYTIDCHPPALHERSNVRSHCHIPTVAS